MNTVTLYVKSGFFGKDREPVQAGSLYECDEDTAKLVPVSRAEVFDPNKHPVPEGLENREGKGPVKRGKAKAKTDDDGAN